MHRIPSFAASLLILVLGLLNLFSDRQDLFFFADHLSWLPKLFSVPWTLLMLGLVWLPQALRARGPRAAPRLAAGHRTALILLALAAMVFASTVIWRTRYPTLLGDGVWSIDWQGKSELRFHLKDFLDETHDQKAGFRLQAWLHRGISRFLLVPTDLEYHSFLSRDNMEKSEDSFQSWFFVCWIGGLALLAIAASWSHRVAGGNPLLAASLFVFAATSSLMVHACGHCDSYIVPACAVVAWFAVLSVASPRLGPCSVAIESRGLRGLVNSVVSLRVSSVLLALLCVGLAFFAHWSHPIAVFALVYLGLLLFLKWLRAYGVRIHVGWVLLVAIALGCVPFLRPAHIEYLFPYPNPLSFHRKLGLLLSHARNLLHVGFAAVFAMLCVLGPRRLRNPWYEAEDATALVMCLTSIAHAMVLHFAFGMLNELTYSVPIMFLVTGALWLLLRDPHPLEKAWPSAVLSVFLFFPKIILYSGPGMFTRCERVFPKEICEYSITLSPGIYLGLAAPVTDPAMQEARLRIFRKGWENPLPEWDTPVFRISNLQEYIAWAYEFDRDAEATQALLTLWNISPDSVIPLWLKGTCYTTCWRNVAYQKVRTMSRTIIEENLGRGVQSDMLKKARDLLQAVQAQSP